ncbi:MAG: Mur ligase family protein [Bacteroidales bacterium]|nr:Mur ligase family protein [Bacteroidales bacterium]
MNIHFIAIGGAAMHNLAIALHKKGHHVTGSDDEIFEPSKSRLAHYGLLPETEGWHPEKLSQNIDAVILGMHAKEDNPELQQAKKMGLKIYSYPEYLYEVSKHKTRIVIGGSHGKTTITAMILHVFKQLGIETDYMVGAKLKDFDVMVKISDAPVMVFEGDEYLTSALDPRPKFHLYRPDIALLSGIAWDHINVFPTFEKYVEQFKIFVDLIEPNGKLIYCQEDKEVCKVAEKSRSDIQKIPYGIPDHRIKDGNTLILYNQQEIPLSVFGIHNLMNIEGAKNVCNAYGIDDNRFYQAISSFQGAANRLETVFKDEQTIMFKDFAHSPSKLKATIQAVKEQFPERKLIACMELHTYSSLSQAFLSQYKDSMKMADVAFVFFNPHAIALKRLQEITKEQVLQGFGTNNVTVFTDSDQLWQTLKEINPKDKSFLMMSSGNFDGKILSDILSR